MPSAAVPTQGFQWCVGHGRWEYVSLEWELETWACWWPK